LGLVLVIVGFFGVWVDHRTAALAVTGPELAEFAKFFPQVQGGTVPVIRGLFLTPVVAVAVVLGLVVSRFATRPAVRLVGTGLSALLALVALPPYEYTFSPDYRLHLVLVGCGVWLTFLTPLTHRLGWRAWGLLLALAALVGVAFPLWQFALLRPLIVALYGQTFGLGWGLVLFVVGSVLLAAEGILAAIRTDDR
jgi:hypothetical protein